MHPYNNYDLGSIHLGIVCPMANENDTAEDFTAELLAQCHKLKRTTLFIICDMASKDGTVNTVANLQKHDSRIKLIWAPENKCVVDAYVRGYHEALEAGCDWILEIDAGYSHLPSDLHQYFGKITENQYDCIFGSRFCDGGMMIDSSFRRYILSKGGTFLVNLLLRTTLKDMTSGYQMFSRDALLQVLDRGIQSRGHFFQTEIKVYCMNMRISEVPIHYRSPSSKVGPRVIGDALYNLTRLAKLLLLGVLSNQRAKA